MTLTIGHNQTDLLEDRVQVLSKMRGQLLAHRVIKDLNLLCYHSTLEVVYGKSGWHAHYHIMLCKDGEMTAAQTEAIGQRWEKIGSKIGIAVNIEKGFTIGTTKCVDAAAVYLSKSPTAEDLGKKMSLELASDNKSYRNNESYAIQQLIGLAAAGRWKQISYSKQKVENLIVEYLQVKNINYFRGCKRWNAIVELSADEKLDDDNKEKNVKKFIEISARAFIELSNHDLLLGRERKDSKGNIIEHDGILIEHRRNEDIEDTYGYILYLLEIKKEYLYDGIEKDINRVVVVDEKELKQDLAFSSKIPSIESTQNKEYSLAA
jgi:hypothetical protein